jgi:hypothetical protein
MEDYKTQIIILAIGIMAAIIFFITLPDRCPKCGGQMIDWSTKKSYCEECGYVE